MVSASPFSPGIRSSSLHREAAEHSFVVQEGRKLGPVRLPTQAQSEFIESFNEIYLALGFQIQLDVVDPVRSSPSCIVELEDR